VFSVLKHACETWTMYESLKKRINAFEYWCYWRMLKISWKDKLSDIKVLKRIEEKELQFYKKIAQQKLSYAGHVLRGSNDRNVLVIIEGKIRVKK